MMNLLSTLFAITISAPAPADSCAAYLLTDSGCEQTLRLTTYQRRQLALLRTRTHREVASLDRELRRIDIELRTARGLTRSRLLRRRSLLISQMRRQRAVASARINTMLSPRQRRRCQLRRPIPSRPKIHVTPRPVPRKHHVKPYHGNRRVARQAPPWTNKASKGRNRTKSNQYQSNRHQPSSKEMKGNRPSFTKGKRNKANSKYGR